MAKKKIDIDKYASGLFVRTEQYADKVRQHYATAVEELLKLSANASTSPDKAFSFSDNKKLSGKANNVLRGLYSAVYNEIRSGVSAEWEYANLSCDALIESIFGKGLAEDNHFARWFSRNQEAMDAFFARKSAYGGMNLSQRVWKYTGQFKDEMELALSLSLGQGDSASTVSRKVRQYLQEPDRLFRRIRIGTNADGTPKFKLSKAAKAYHPGRGVYRSSYKNAMRLTRSETNMAYRTSEQDRWQRMDFVVGYEIKLSNNHPVSDICNDLAGKYPKSFVFKGWHPQCRCVCTPILSTEDEFIKMQERILAGKSPSSVRKEGTISRPPEKFYKWLEDNKGRIESATNMPYWMQDNQDYINKKRKVRVRTDEEREALRQKWAERSKKYQQIQKMAGNILKVAQEYPEIDLTTLQSFIDKKNINQMNIEARSVAKRIVEIRKDEKALSTLIPDVHDWKKQFTSEQLHEVYDAVEAKLSSWSSLTLEEQAKKLHFEAYDFLGGNMKGVQAKYATWKVSQSAYIKELVRVQEAIDWKDIDDVLKEALSFKTKSKPYLDLVGDLQNAIADGNLTNAKAIKASMQAKRAELAKAAQARAKKKSDSASTFEDDAYTDERKSNALWTTRKDADGRYNRTDGDDYFRPFAENDWKRWDDNQKDVAYLYTSGSSYINEPLYTKYYSTKYGLKGEVRNSMDDIRTLTDMIDSATPFTRDVWLNRGASLPEFFGQFGVELDDYFDDPTKFIGREGLQKPFMSTAHSKSWGFVDDGEEASRSVVYNIYCPRGTKGIYTEPYSAYGYMGRNGRNWDGVSKNPVVNEVEVILQQGTKLRITKIEQKNGIWFVDMDVIGQNPV